MTAKSIEPITNTFVECARPFYFQYLFSMATCLFVNELMINLHQCQGNKCLNALRIQLLFTKYATRGPNIGRTGAFSCSSSALPQQISVVVVILICLELQPNQDVKVNHDSITQRELLANTKTVSLHYI